MMENALIDTLIIIATVGLAFFLPRFFMDRNLGEWHWRNVHSCGYHGELVSTYEPCPKCGACDSKWDRAVMRAWLFGPWETKPHVYHEMPDDEG